MKILSNNLDNVRIQKGFIKDTPKLKMKDRIGFLPISIWRPDWTIVKKLKKVIGDKGETREIDYKSKNYRKGGMFSNNKKLHKKGNYGKEENNVSIFNPHLAQMILSAYAPKNSKIYDPFAGGGTRAFIADSMGHDYFGVELRKEEVAAINKRKKELGSNFNIIVGDSTKTIVKRNFYDFSYTCPPYFDLEVYSDLSSDMSNAKSYEEFLCMLKESIKITFKALKKGALFACVVGNFRNKKGQLVYFNGDLVSIGLSVGFALHDDIIFQGASNNAVQRCGNFAANRKSVRVHEHILIFKK